MELGKSVSQQTGKDCTLPGCHNVLTHEQDFEH
jgi:hypothetical protein